MSTQLRDRPSWAMRFVVAYLGRTRTKQVLSDVEATEADRLRNRRRGPAAPRRAHRRRFVITEHATGGQRWHLVTPRTGQATRTIVYLHGGGYINPCVVQHWDLVCALAQENEARVVVPTYELAPDGGADRATTLLADLHVALTERFGQAPAWAGDSAGGGLALATTYVLRDRGRALPTHLLLLAPWLDVRLAHPGIDAVLSSDPTLALPGLRAAGAAWAGGLPLEDPRVSPGCGDPSGLPPTTVVVGDRDVFVADCRDFAAAAAAAGVDVELVESPGAFHVFPAATFLPESRQARRVVTARLAAQPV